MSAAVTLNGIARAIVACERCPRLRAWCTKVAHEKVKRFRDWEYWGRPVPGFGAPDARLFIVGLAPAAHGGNRTGRVFTGDSSGDWLYAALHKYGFATQPTSTSREDGLELLDCYVAAAARCAPPDNKPTREELDNCRPYLESELRVLTRLKVIVTLGGIAHDSLLRAIGWHTGTPSLARRPPFAHGEETKLPGGITLLSSYHPSRQNTNTGRLTRAMWHAIFRRARTLVDS